TGVLRYRGENGRPRVLGGKEKKAIGQYIRYNNEITLNEIKEKLSKMHHKSVSTSTISRHLHEYGDKNVLPQSTQMLTSDEKQQRVQWAKKHINDDFNTTIFTDESSFQLFRKTVRRWTKNPNQEFKCSPKNRQKVHVWDVISVKGILTCHTFRCNLDGP
ncbi:unnamed protein product, partial [Rotaria sordida]